MTLFAAFGTAVLTAVSPAAFVVVAGLESVSTRFLSVTESRVPLKA